MRLWAIKGTRSSKLWRMAVFGLAKTFDHGGKRMKHSDDKYGCTMEVPDSWLSEGRGSHFSSTGGKFVYESPDGGASINLSTGLLDRPHWIDKKTRAKDMKKFLSIAPREYGKSKNINADPGFHLDGEDNTILLQYEMYAKTGFLSGYNKIVSTGIIVSAVHNNVEYVIQIRDDAQRTHEYEILSCLESFKY
jgi:hypothetical protein